MNELEQYLRDTFTPADIAAAVKVIEPAWPRLLPQLQAYADVINSISGGNAIRRRTACR